MFSKTFTAVALATSCSAEFQADLQAALDKFVASHETKYPNLTMSFAWYDQNGEIAVASGKVGDRATTTKDTFLYGSGTKPITAASVLSLVDRGLVKGDDKAVKFLDPYFKAMGKPSMEDYFGPEINDATVIDVIRMASGIRDFEDSFSFDKWVLGNATKVWDNYPYDAMSFSVSDENIQAGGGSGPLICNTGGNCTSYSSTSYDVAGLLLASVLAPGTPWSSFDLGDVLFEDRRDLIPNAKFPAANFKLSDHLTVPGYSIDTQFSPDPVTIYEQDASILGFTCGNMITAPTDVAKYFYWLLDTEGSKQVPLLSKGSQDVMTDTTILTRGWEAGRLAYGAGIQDRCYGAWHSKNCIAVKGHEGATYAFLSASGYVPELKGGFSVVGNTDVGGVPIQSACSMLEVVKRYVTGNMSFSLGCRSFEDVSVVV